MLSTSMYLSSSVLTQVNNVPFHMVVHYHFKQSALRAHGTGQNNATIVFKKPMKIGFKEEMLKIQPAGVRWGGGGGGCGVGFPVWRW